MLGCGGVVVASIGFGCGLPAHKCAPRPLRRLPTSRSTPCSERGRFHRLGAGSASMEGRAEPAKGQAVGFPLQTYGEKNHGVLHHAPATRRVLRLSQEPVFPQCSMPSCGNCHRRTHGAKPTCRAMCCMTSSGIPLFQISSRLRTPSEATE